MSSYSGCRERPARQKQILEHSQKAISEEAESLGTLYRSDEESKEPADQNTFVSRQGTIELVDEDDAEVNTPHLVLCEEQESLNCRSKSEQALRRPMLRRSTFLESPRLGTST